MGRMIKKSLDRPDDQISMEWLSADVVQVGDASIARTVMRPGAACSISSGTKSCKANHAGVVVSGRMHVMADDGSTIDFGPNDVFDVAPGHDASVIGDEPLVFITWSGFRTWLPDARQTERVLLTLLFTDIVGSTERLVEIGDRSWRELLGQHNNTVRNALDRYHGREVATTGDGFLVAFDGPGRAVQAALAIRDQAADLGIQIRQGIHTGEVELVGSEVRGVAVHEAARVAAGAGAGEILVSATTYTLASGSGLTFEARGERELKGLTGPRTLYAATGLALTQA